MRLISVPSSSGCTFQLRRCGRFSHDLKQISVPSSSGCTFQRLRKQPCGCWVLSFQSPLHRDVRFNHLVHQQGHRADEFQSPLHRDVRFNEHWYSCALRQGVFQSPLHRDVRFNMKRQGRGGDSMHISVPSSSGCTFQRGPMVLMHREILHFSPLFIGMYVSTILKIVCWLGYTGISVPSSSGCTFQLVDGTLLPCCIAGFQSPLHRDVRFNLGVIEAHGHGVRVFQSPLHRDVRFNFDFSSCLTL